MSVMFFDLANDQPGHVAGAQGELEGRLGPVLGERAGPRARVRGWQEGLWTQVGCSYHLFCNSVLTKFFIFYTLCSAQVSTWNLFPLVGRPVLAHTMLPGG